MDIKFTASPHWLGLDKTLEAEPAGAFLGITGEGVFSSRWSFGGGVILLAHGPLEGIK